jgi:hypothetical protein
MSGKAAKSTQDAPVNEAAEQALREEIERRLRSTRNGSVTLVPRDDVYARLSGLLQQLSGLGSHS